MRVLGEGCRRRPPAELCAHAAAWGPFEARAFDLPALARAARAALGRVLPPALAAGAPGSRPPNSISNSSDSNSNPADSNSALDLSYWAAANLPLEPGLRQALLAVPHGAARLRLLLALLGRADRVACAG